MEYPSCTEELFYDIVDEAGAVQNRYEYDAWGNITAQEEAVPNRFKFTGQQLDPVTQQYYLRARFYNPVVAQFTQEDTYRGDGLNLYAYCENNPVFYVDPTGHVPQCLKNAYNKYRLEGKDAKTAYELAQKDYAEAKARGETIPAPLKPNNEGFKEYVRKEKAFLEQLSKEQASSGRPVFEVSRSQYPNYVAMLEAAQAEGHSLTDLERGPGRRAAERNRYLSQKGIRAEQGGPPKGYDYDEFPYASTVQGGTGAHVEPVPSGENQAVGRDLGAFYRTAGVDHGDHFDIRIVD